MAGPNPPARLAGRVASRAASAAAVVLALVLASGGCAVSGAPPVALGDEARSTERDGTQPSLAMALVTGGIARPITPDEELAVGRSMIAQLALTVGDAGHRTLRLRLRASDGTPLSGASVVATIQMRYMDHGEAVEDGLPGAPGEYTVPIEFEMPGERRIDLAVMTDGDQAELHLDVDDFR